MHLFSAALKQGVRTDSAPGDDTTLRGRWLLAARGAWLATALLTLAMVAMAIPVEYARLQQICLSGDCEHPHMTPESLRDLEALGLSAGFFATYFIGVILIFILVWCAAGALIFWRKSDDRAALFVALFLVTFGASFPLSGAGLRLGAPFWSFLSACIGFLGVATIGLFPYLYPTGHFVPHWTKWLSIAWIALQVPILFFPDSPFNSERWPPAAGIVLNLVLFGAMLGTQIYRYRRVSSQLQRQQTKWLIFSFALAIATLIVLSIISASALPAGLLAELIGSTAIFVAFSFIPISIAFAILRYRLWDIDILINRALVYGTLTIAVV
ncbi:MAG TPA: hypothetical protein VFU22_23260, partial [Roseiflexaceae bacterium]|nr:hypothetical protein [Roseiflexaceae bacterium]